MPAAVQITDLCKSFTRRVHQTGAAGKFRALFRPRQETVHAVRGLNLEMQVGESLALVGPNGAGKSTTIKILTGILHPTSGDARVLGLVPWRQRTRLAMNIATVFGQRSQLWFHLPAGETFDLLARIYEIPSAEYRARRREMIRRFELEPLIGTAVRKLSLGERMRCEIAASLLHRPRILFLDEPTIGLDVVAKQEIRSFIRTLNRDEEVTVLLTSHDAGDIEHLCKRVIIINHGVSVFDDRVSTLKRRYLDRKVISLRLLEETADRPDLSALRDWPGVTILTARNFGIKLEIDTEVRTMAEVMARLGEWPLADITIEDPPMEEIISAIYKSAQSASRTASGGEAT